jgi:hypothetical protein
MASLKEMGTPDLEVSADTAFFAVFRRADGQRTYLAYHPGNQARTVTFSDGQVLQVEPRRLARVVTASPKKLNQ